MSGARVPTHTHTHARTHALAQVTSCRLRTVDVSVQRLQRFVSRLAAAVHAADPRALVTVGSHSPPYCSDAQVGVAREQGVMDAGIALLH